MKRHDVYFVATDPPPPSLIRGSIFYLHLFALRGVVKIFGRGSLFILIKVSSFSLSNARDIGWNFFYLLTDKFC